MSHLPRIARICILAVACISLAGGPAFAGPHGRPGGPNHHAPAHHAGHIRGGISRDDARRMARDHHMSGYKPLPPRTRKLLIRGRRFPQGIERRPLPDYYVRRLPAHPGYEWYSVGTDLVLMGVGTAVIADVISNVF